MENCNFHKILVQDYYNKLRNFRWTKHVVIAGSKLDTGRGNYVRKVVLRNINRAAKRKRNFGNHYQKHSDFYRRYSEV